MLGSIAAVLTAAVVLLATATAQQNYVDCGADLEKLSVIKSVFDSPRPDAVGDGEDTSLNWFTSWRDLLHIQIDGLFSALEHRAAARAEEASGGPSPNLEVDDGLGFRIAVFGDSTLRMQVTALSWLLSQRTTTDGRSQCFDASDVGHCSMMDVRCTGADGGVDEDGSAPKDVIFSITYILVSEAFEMDKLDADFVYFGMGLHLLHLFPVRRMETAHTLDIWMHYERLLEEAVTFYRSGGKNAGSRVPIGEVFMTTHSISSDDMDGSYALYAREYRNHNSSVLAMCRSAMTRPQPAHPEWDNEYESEDICTYGAFNDEGVVNLNIRAESVMTRLGVAVVQGYDITHGQSWATPLEDGRHYPALIPVELNAFLAEISTALRQEKRAKLR